MRLGVVNVPMTYPPKEVNGYLVSGIMTPSLKSDFTFPSDLKDELLDAIPGYNILNISNAGDDHEQEADGQRSAKPGRGFLRILIFTTP